MCDICRQTPCHPRCPNAPESKPVKRCCLCGEGIYEGDEYLITTDGCVCKDCLEDFSINQWLELIGESLTTAESAVYGTQRSPFCFRTAVFRSQRPPIFRQYVMTSTS